MSCTCEEQCKGFSHCMCLSYPDTPEFCECDRWGPVVLMPLAIKYGKRAADVPFVLCVKDAELSTVGESLSKRFEVQIYILANQIRKMITMTVKNASLSEVVKSIGLVLAGNSQ
jgi:hypothetical protein